jgi:hypothetical protein
MIAANKKDCLRLLCLLITAKSNKTIIHEIGSIKKSKIFERMKYM